MEAPLVSIFGVPITNLTTTEATDLMVQWIEAGDGRSRAVFIVNAHTLNLAWDGPTYRQVLNTADAVFADGTGARLAARLHRVRLRDNLVGTDLLAAFVRRWPGRYRLFLLGGEPGRAALAAQRLQREVPGTQIAGHHHGFIGEAEHPAVIDEINACRPDILLVGMGNPRQEIWIHRSLPLLRVPLSIGVGGLLDHWAGHLHRAAPWVRKLGMEWFQILLQQPHKWRRYLLGNPKFVFRALVDAHAHAAANGGSERRASPRVGGSENGGQQ